MQEQSIFIEALEKETPAERAAYLMQACGSDVLLRQRLERLLERHHQTDSFLDAPAALLTPSSADAALDSTGTLLGPYQLLKQIGEGGFGVVYLAEQQQPLHRRVALKILKPGMDSQQVIARFEAERQALALMDHPNIARVLDAGATAAGRPYFVMELVQGVPITEFCDQKNLAIRERLALFVSVCLAVQHAHQKGIIHRDLKPSNILVTVRDGAAVAKVIDFGIAKALGQPLTDRTLQTGGAQLLGTPLYMSPEQAGLSSQDVDTRSDIYSLGVLLYELLTGTTPFDSERLRAVSYDELRRIIREEDPPRPSTRLRKVEGRGMKEEGGKRGGSRSSFQELDWIVMKALDKDRGRRYESASAFAADVERYLRDEPVQACPPSARYRLGKFVRRNKRALATGALVAVLLVAALGTAGVFAAWWAQQRAVTAAAVGTALDEVARLCSEGHWLAALAAARRADALLESGGGGQELRRQVQDVLADVRMVVKIEDMRLAATALKDGHFDGAQMDAGYAEAFRTYGIDVAALEPAQAVERIAACSVCTPLAATLDRWAMLRKELHPADERWRHLLAVARGADPDAWRNRLRDALASGDRAALCELVDVDTVTDVPPSTLVLLGSALINVQAPDRAVALLRQAQRRHRGDFWVNHELARALQRLPAPPWEEVIRACAAAVAIRPQSPVAHYNLGHAFRSKGALDEAAAAYREAVRLAPHYAFAHDNLGAVLKDQGKVEEAIAEFRLALAIDPKLAMAYSNLGSALLSQGHFDNASAACRKAIELKPNFAPSHHNLAIALKAQGKPEEAVAEFRLAIAAEPTFAAAHTNLGAVLQGQGKLDEAITVYQQAIAAAPKYALAYDHLGRAFWAKGKEEEAIACYRRAIDLNPRDAWPHSHLGNALRDQGKLEEAVAHFNRAIALDPRFELAHGALGQALVEQGRFVEARPSIRRCLELLPGSHRLRAPITSLLQRCEGLLDLEQKLPEVLAGRAEPANSLERLDYAWICSHHKRYADAARMYADAFRASPKLAGDVGSHHRYHAACAAALAGCRRGKDADTLDDSQSARLRRQALDWLRQDLTAWCLLLEKLPDRTRGPGRRMLRRWQWDPDFAGMRGDNLGLLPDSERQAWQQLWADVEQTLGKAD
jgi:serine/threonine protein kinase/Tfp pilus assembly protein PilF